jgi:hypothetical protein
MSRQTGIAEGEWRMKTGFFICGLALLLAPVAANAQLTVDMRAIKCADYLAMPASTSANFSAWMSGWFSYQTHRPFVDLVTHRKNVANVKEWCKYHQQESVQAGVEKALGPQ